MATNSSSGPNNPFKGHVILGRSVNFLTNILNYFQNCNHYEPLPESDNRFSLHIAVACCSRILDGTVYRAELVSTE